MTAFLTWFKGNFTSPADLSGLTAVLVSLATGIGSALALPGGPTRTDAFIAAAVVAAYGILQILRPDNAAVKSTTLIADSETAVRDALTALASRNPTAFAAILADAAKIAGDLTSKAASTAAALVIALAFSLGLLMPIPAHAYDTSAITTPSRVATYAAAILGLTPASAATDFFTVQGSATTVVRIKELSCFGTSTAAASMPIKLNLLSSADTGGTALNLTEIPQDPNDAAASASVSAYTANPTLGTVSAPVRIGLLGMSATAPGAATGNLPLLFQFGRNNDKEIVLRGLAQELALNAGGTSFAAGTSLNCYVEWTESGS